jgi:DNA-binding transcriptional ArsR family regulator
MVCFGRMARRRTLEQSRKHITKDILLSSLSEGIHLTVDMIEAHSVRYLLRRVYGASVWEEYYPSSISRHTTKLWRKGLVDVRQTKDGCVVVLTEKGKTEVLKYDIDNLSIPKQEPWDGKWRMVFFDIDTESHATRNAFREHLKTMGFFQIQKSVYVHPYPCTKELQYLREVLEVPHSVKLATVEQIENDEDLQRYFKLQ